MFEFAFPRFLRFVTYDCCPLSNRDQVVEVMRETGVDKFELADRLDVDVSLIDRWLEGEVRPRYRDIDKVCLVCEFEPGTGFGEDSPLLDGRDGWSDDDFVAYDPDPEGTDRKDMESVGYMSTVPSRWEVGPASLRGNTTIRTNESYV